MSLDLNSADFQQLVEKLGQTITRLYEGLERKPVFPGKSPSEVQGLFDEPLPEEGMEIARLLEKVERDVFDSSTLNIGPGFYGYITGGGNQVAMLAEMLKAALNQNNLKWHSSPVSTELEKLVIRWIAEFVGYPADCTGALLGGGSVANFECLAVARKNKAPVDLSEEGLYNCPPLTVYVSSEGHSSFDKAVDMLGTGKKFLRKIPVDDRFRIDPEELEKRIEEDIDAGMHPVCAIGIAGTTNTGAVDDLEALADICTRHNLWFHVDAAYGGPAAALEETGPLFGGIGRADSLVVNPHKWLYVPFEAGATLYKNPETVHKTFSTIPDYLKSDRQDDGRTDQMEYNLPLTKDFKALKVWMTIKAYGAQRLREAIRADIEKADYLVQKIKESGKLELLAPAPLSIVCFRYNPGQHAEEALEEMNGRLISSIEKDGRIFLTGTKIRGKTALRVCFINHRSGPEDVDFLVKVIEELIGGLEETI